eukprot:GDKI01009286.1.p3 GENE.GDKI01009286.1~~GDKI01009286.1.p3  ORF type:complete len:103 (+),score=26.74 GDKI01009286.1:548-856(+)
MCCRFGTVSVPAVWVNRQCVKCVAPPHPAGVVSLSVSFDGGNFIDPPANFCFAGERTVEEAIAVRCDLSVSQRLQVACQSNTHALRTHRGGDGPPDPGAGVA